MHGTRIDKKKEKYIYQAAENNILANTDAEENNEPVHGIRPSDIPLKGEVRDNFYK